MTPYTDPPVFSTACAPRRVVAMGGGTGMPSVLRGLRRYVERGEVEDLVAVVTMTDDGGSSGRLRRSRGMPPPGDVRKCLVALSAEEEILAGLFEHRYEGAGELGGHTMGNLFLAALAEQTGSFLKAVEVSSRVLRTAGRILPSTLDDVTLEAECADGTRIRGESKIGRAEKPLRKIDLVPRSAAATPGVVEAILEADLVVLGPGSLFTSLVPNLLVRDVGAALRRTGAVVVLVANFVSEKGEAAGLELDDHIRILEQHIGGEFIDAVLLHGDPIAADVAARYRAEGAVPLGVRRGVRPGIRVSTGPLAAPGTKLRHDPEATAGGIVALWQALRNAPDRRGAAGIVR